MLVLRKWRGRILTGLAALGLLSLPTTYVLSRVHGPRLVAEVRGIRDKEAMAGCTGYMIVVRPLGGTIDHFNLIVQLPTVITDYKFYVTPVSIVGHGRVSADVFAIGEKNGRCIEDIRFDLRRTELEAHVVGGTLLLPYSKLDPHATIMGMAVTTGYTPAVTPPITLIQGRYEYTRLGYTVEKDIEVNYLGITDRSE